MLLFIEGPSTGGGLCHLRWALDHGHDPVLVTTDWRKHTHVPCSDVLEQLGERSRVLQVPSTEDETVPDSLRALAGGRDLGVVCMTDRHLRFAASVAAALGCPFASPDAVRILRDKRRARRLFAELEVRTVRWADATSADGVTRFMEEVGAPIVLKNCRGTGSLDVLLCRTPAEAVAHFHELEAAERYLSGPLMVEEFVAGPLFSLETVVSLGTCRHLGVTDRQLGPRPAFCELSSTFPAAVPDAVRRAMEEVVESCVHRLRIPQGFLHTEFVVDERGPVIVELNARVGGGMMSRQMSDCVSTPVSELLCRAALGLPIGPIAHNGDFSTNVTVYADRAGRLTSVDNLEEVASAPFVREVVPFAGAGDQVRPPRDYRGAVCKIRTTAGSGALAYNAAVAAARDLRFTVE